MQHRRLARDYEALPHRSEAMIHIAAINLMTRRLTAKNTHLARHLTPDETDKTEPNVH
ncbi:hypothetical protein GA0115240_115011 [Streptomyces sp. DvalAA-14]|nr:hypothetical protein GA0115240_115011 [Streptomyces sp. DvalAA-14]